MSIPVWHTTAGFLGTLTERKTISNYVTIEKSVAEVNITNNGINYSQGIGLLVSSPQSINGNNITATLIPGVDPDSGSIADVVISNQGSGYAVPPTVQIVKPASLTISAEVSADPYVLLTTVTNGIYVGMAVTGTLFDSTSTDVSKVSAFLQGVGTFTSSITLTRPVSTATTTGTIGTTYFRDIGTSATVTVTALSNTATYKIVSGSLPIGLSLNTNTGLILGTPNSVARNTKSQFVVRASNQSGVIDRTFSYEVNGPTEPVWITPSGNLPVGMNGEYFSINKEWVDYTLRADIDVLDSGNKLKFYIGDRDGQLPPGLKITKDGRIYGYLQDELAVPVSISSSAGGYDSDPFDSAVYEHSVYNTTTASTNSYINKYTISGVLNENPMRMIFTTPHNLTDGDKILVSGVDGLLGTVINGVSYLVKVYDPFIVQLYEINADQNSRILVTPIDGTNPIYYPYQSGGYAYWGTFNPNQPKSIKKSYQFYVTVTDGVASSRRAFNIEVVDHNSLRVDTSYISVDSELFNVSADYILSPIWQSKNGDKLPRVGNLGAVRAGKKLILDTYDYDPYPLQGPVYYDWNTCLVNPDIKLVLDGIINAANLQTKNLQGQSAIYYKDAEITPVKGMKICFGDYIPNTDNTVYTVTGVIPLSDTRGILNIDQPLAQQLPDSRRFYVGTSCQKPPGISLDPKSGKLYGQLINQPTYSQSYRFSIKIVKIDQTSGDKTLNDAIGDSDSRIINKIYTTLTNSPPTGTGGLTPAASYTGAKGDIWLVGQTAPVLDNFLLPYMDGTIKAYVFTGRDNPSWVYIGEVVTNTQVYLLNVLGNVISSISFISTSSLGTLTPGEVSELYVLAQNTGTNYSVEYEIVQGQLPPGLTFNPDGTIQGRVINSGQTYFDFTNNEFLTIDGGATTVDKNWKFTVRASDAYRLSAVEKEFYVTVYQDTSTEFTRMYVKPFLHPSKRKSFKEFVTDTIIFDPVLLYRPTDPEFGIQQEIKMILETGIEKASLDEYASAINSYFYRKRFYFGAVKSIKAKDSAGNWVYDLVYVDIIDDQMNGNFAPSQSVSVVNMQNILESITLNDQTTIEVNEKLRPRFMSTLQEDTGVAIGFVKVIPLCYTIPGGSVKILSRITNALNTGQFSFFNYNFDTDRIIIESTTDSDNEQWLLYTTARQ